MHMSSYRLPLTGKHAPTLARHCCVCAGRQKAPDAAAAHRERVSAEALAALLVEWLPDMEGCGEEAGLAAAVAAELRGPAQAAFDTALEAVFTAGAEVLWLQTTCALHC